MRCFAALLCCHSSQISEVAKLSYSQAIARQWSARLANQIGVFCERTVMCPCCQALFLTPQCLHFTVLKKEERAQVCQETAEERGLMKVIGDHFLYCLLHVYLPKSSQVMVLSFVIFWGETL